jgi:hypothetical protein
MSVYSVCLQMDNGTSSVLSIFSQQVIILDETMLDETYRTDLPATRKVAIGSEIILGKWLGEEVSLLTLGLGLSQDLNQ